METPVGGRQETLDRRAMRSKRLILSALRELILEKDYKKITVSDIVERADVGRATFYAHFEDKDDLKRYIFGQLLSQLQMELENALASQRATISTYQRLVPSLALFRVIAEKHRFFKVNATTPGIGLTMLQQPLVARLESQLEEAGSPDEAAGIPRRMAACYLVSALIALLTDWVMDDMPLSPEAMDEIYQSLAGPTFKRLLVT